VKEFVERSRLRLDELRERIEHNLDEDRLHIPLTLVISATVGLVIVAFVVVTERLGGALIEAGAWQRFVSPTIGSLLAGWLVFRYFPDARGSGIPQTRIALILQNGVIRIRTVLGKLLCSTISLGSGVALGREGPSVQIGAGIASVIARTLGLSESSVRSLIPVGTAAAIAAAFNTPLAAVLFTLEEILADLHARVVGSVVIGAATSWIVLRLLLGDEPLFHVPGYQLVHPAEFLAYAVLGIAGGLVSTVFVRLLLRLREGFLRIDPRWKPLTPAVGGLTVGILALAVPGVLGAGYHLVGEALNGQMGLRMMALLLMVRIVATAVCYSSGNPGGIFGPALFIGAMLGGTVGHIVHTLFPDQTGNAGAYALVGMGAAFAGIIRTPMTSVIMIFEVTRDYTIIVPVMIANLCSYFIAQRMERRTVYESISRQEGITLPAPSHRLAPLTVSQAMRAPESNIEKLEQIDVQIYPDEPLDAALRIMGSRQLEEVPIRSRIGQRIVGALSVRDVLKAYRVSSDEPRQPSPLAVPEPEDGPPERRRLLPALGAIAGAALLLIGGYGLWQRTQLQERTEEASREAESLLAQGRTGEAIQTLRKALASAPRDGRVRAALGLALADMGLHGEAEFHLSRAAQEDPDNALIPAGRAEVAAARGQRDQAIILYRLALSREWPPEAEARRVQTIFEYARLLAASKRETESVAVLMELIDRSGGDMVTAKKAAGEIREIGTLEQTETAWVALARQFPQDAGVWLRVGDVRLDLEKDALALTAYRQALAVEPENREAHRAVEIVEQMRALDPTVRRLSFRQRAQRWTQILQLAIRDADNCSETETVARARALLNQRAANLAQLDALAAATLDLWRELNDACKVNVAVDRLLSRMMRAEGQQ
jgi:CIC family chloride channel protein